MKSRATLDVKDKESYQSPTDYPGKNWETFMVPMHILSLAQAHT